MYQFQPKRQNKIASIMLLVFAVLSVALVGISAVITAYAGILQAAAVLLLAVETMLFVRYFKKSYVYRLQGFNTANDAPDFIVSEISGKSNVILCRLSLSDLVAIREKHEKCSLKEPKKYNYCVDISPKSSVRLDFSDGYENSTIIIMPDEKMLSVFREYLEKNQAESSGEN